MKSTFIFSVLNILFGSVLSNLDEKFDAQEKVKEQWKKHAKDKIKLNNENFKKIVNDAKSVAKNVILFLGDGMGPTVITAARIYRSQKFSKSNGTTPAMPYQHPFHFETLAQNAFVKTHCFDTHVTDSAAAATALMCGAKVPIDAVSSFEPDLTIDGRLTRAALVQCVGALALEAGKSVGVVSTTRVTHGTPSVLYAHNIDRFHETASQKKPRRNGKYEDIAYQMTENYPGNNFTIILGGGSSYFQPCSKNNQSKSNCRTDNVDLLTGWENGGTNRALIRNKLEMDQVDTEKVDQILGLFSDDHMTYVVDKTQANGEPSLDEMAEFALKMLTKNQKGYFLLIEGGRIDTALHANNAKRSFEELIAFDDAIKKVSELVDFKDTLIIVTADHSHNLNLKGYAKKTESILGFLPIEGRTPILDGKNWTMITFSDGPAANPSNVVFEDPESKDYQQKALIWREGASHGGEDVVAYAQGPGAHLFTGSLENTDIFYFMCFAMRLDYCRKFDSFSETTEKSFLNWFSIESLTDAKVSLALAGFLTVSLIFNLILVYRSRRASRSTFV